MFKHSRNNQTYFVNSWQFSQIHSYQLYILFIERFENTRWRWKPKFFIYLPLHIWSGSSRLGSTHAHLYLLGTIHNMYFYIRSRESYVDYSSSTVCISSVHVFMGRICILCPRCILVSAGFKALSGICLLGRKRSSWVFIMAIPFSLLPTYSL